MASVSVFCIICAASLHKTGNRRQLFSASSRPLVPLLTTYASLSHGPHLILHKCNQGTDYYKYGLGALYPLPQKVKGLGKKAVAKAFATACRQRYKNVHDLEENVSLPTLGLVAARCIRGLWWHNLLPC